MLDGISPSGASSLALLQATGGDSKKSLDELKKASNLNEIEEAAREFESVFIAEMMKPMFAGIKSDEMFGGGKGEEVFQGMMLQEYGKMIARTGSIGLADQVKAAMIQLQSEANQSQNNQNEGAI